MSHLLTQYNASKKQTHKWRDWTDISPNTKFRFNWTHRRSFISNCEQLIPGIERGGNNCFVRRGWEFFEIIDHVPSREEWPANKSSQGDSDWTSVVRLKDSHWSINRSIVTLKCTSNFVFWNVHLVDSAQLWHEWKEVVTFWRLFWDVGSSIHPYFFEMFQLTIL